MSNRAGNGWVFIGATNSVFPSSLTLVPSDSLRGRVSTDSLVQAVRGAVT